MSLIVYPYNLTGGTNNRSAQANDNFNEAAGVINGQLDHTNLSANANLTVNQLSLSGEMFNQAGPNTKTWASGLTTDLNPRIAMTTDHGIEFSAGGASSPDLFLQRSAASTLQLNNGSGGPANLDLNGGTLLNTSISFTSVTISGGLSSGTNGGTGGALTLYGSTSGLVTIQVQAAAGITNFTLPVGNGSAGQALVTDGAGNLSWMTVGGSSETIGPFSLSLNNSVPKAHSLGTTPSHAAMLMTCTSNDGIISAGYTVYCPLNANDDINVWLETLTSSDVDVVTGSAIEFSIPSSPFIFSMNPAKWSFTLYLFA